MRALGDPRKVSFEGDVTRSDGALPSGLNDTVVRRDRIKGFRLSRRTRLCFRLRVKFLRRLNPAQRLIGNCTLLGRL